MKPGKTELRLNAEIEKRGALFAVLLDPDTSDEAAFVKAGAMAAENGADLLLVGGSYLGNFTLPKQVAALKANVDLPVVLFPGGASQVVPGFDAMLFMTLVSGRNPNYLIDEQVRGGALVRALNMEAIPTAYELINSGKRTQVEYISGTMPVPANKIPFKWSISCKSVRASSPVALILTSLPSSVLAFTRTLKGRGTIP